MTFIGTFIPLVVISATVPTAVTTSGSSVDTLAERIIVDTVERNLFEHSPLYPFQRLYALGRRAQKRVFRCRGNKHPPAASAISCIASVLGVVLGVVVFDGCTIETDGERYGEGEFSEENFLGVPILGLEMWRIVSPWLRPSMFHELRALKENHG
ncbi:hypothetical protein BJ742DRAFT_531981 [Cladochytrium replicatum]|nr:hypothetical protein BJ742DRAFT_531981 [Cladochytrium replicatum]